MEAQVRFRPGVPADAEALTATVMEAFEGFRSFAPGGWYPPPAQGERDILLQRLAQADVWCLVAEEVRSGGVVGHVAHLPTLSTWQPGAEAGLAHLWQIFVRPPSQGSGVARRLLAAAVDAATAQGFTAMRLFTPTDHDRARRFYEREGWTARADGGEMGSGLALVEYRRALPAGGRRAPHETTNHLNS